MRYTLWLAALFPLLTLPALATDIGESCKADLTSLPDFLRQNDAGAHDRASMPKAAYDKALAALSSATEQDDCLQSLEDYLTAVRPTHLWVQPTASKAEASTQFTGDGKSRAPTLKLLSEQTALLTVPSFHVSYIQPLDDLLKTHKSELAARPNLIIDVRTNDGGGDSTFTPLLKLILQSPTRSYAAEFLASEDNAASFDQVAAILPAQQAKFIQVVAEALRHAPAGTYVMPPAVSPFSIQQWPRHKAPRHVGVLIDHYCGSSCEEFLLMIRQSFNVKLFGRPTLGSLDYSNLVPHTLPSGKYVLWYAISRSRRLPELPVDHGGIQPDQLLKKPADEAGYESEIEEVRKVLEAAG